MTTIERYLGRPEPDEPGVGAATYFHALAHSAGLDDLADEAVRTRGEQAAAGGPGVLASAARAAVERLSAQVAGAAARRRLRVAAGLVMTVDEYLRTRVVELVVHTDDLAVSVGVEQPPAGPATTKIAIDVLIEVARLRHGDMAILRALARRERDQVGALRVL